MGRLSHLFFDCNMRVTVGWRDDRVREREGGNKYARGCKQEGVF